MDRLLHSASPPEQVPMNIHEYVNECAALFLPSFRRASVKRDYDVGLPRGFVATPEQLIQAVLNNRAQCRQAILGAHADLGRASGPG